ncbi:hypothetical protein [Chryseobacterium sp. CT-SW4]|uniref:hypothetical protein n=1 Tax=Chryseobacterium sp. SW-1 TaxID=3157343 RepID=UPI003B0203C5
MFFSCKKDEYKVNISDIPNENNFEITNKKENDSIYQINGKNDQYTLKGFKDIKNNRRVGWWKVGRFPYLLLIKSLSPLQYFKLLFIGKINLSKSNTKKDSELKINKILNFFIFGILLVFVITMVLKILLRNGE